MFEIKKFGDFLKQKDGAVFIKLLPSFCVSFLRGLK